MKSCAFLADTLQDPKVANSYDPREAAIAKALGTKAGLWGYLHESGHEANLSRYSSCAQNRLRNGLLNLTFIGSAWVWLATTL